jgi:hypothetical protein
MKIEEIDLESDLHAACNMAHITAELLEDLFGNKDSHLQLTGGRPDTYFIGSDDVNAMLFAACDLHSRLKELREKYLAAARLT